MKKILCFALVLCMCAALFAGCGKKFDMENADLSAYIKLGDISAFSYEEMCEHYENYREQLSENMASCSVSAGYTIDFFVTADIVNADGTTTAIEEWSLNTDSDYIKGYDVYRYEDNTYFDYGLCYDIADIGDSATAMRTITIGEDFSFTMTLDANYEDETLAGKTVKFTINVKKALPAVYTDSYISDRLYSFYNAVADSAIKDTIEYGDSVTIDFSGSVGGEVFEGGTAENYSFVVGEAGLIDGFEDQLIGHKLNEKFDITVTFPEDYEETLAGKEAVFAITVHNIYNDNALIQNNTPFNDMWELKYALRVESYIYYVLMDVVVERSELIEYPEQLVSDFEKIYKMYVERDIAEGVVTAAAEGVSYTKKEMREILYPDGSDKTYIEEASHEAAFAYMAAVTVLRTLDLSYTDEDYKNDLAVLAEEYTTYYEEEYTPEDIVDLYGEDVLRLSFIEALVTDKLVERVADMPVIPEAAE